MNSVNFAIIVAAGQGLRMKSNIKKQYHCLEKIPILVHTLMAFDHCSFVNEIIVVVPKDDNQYCQTNIINPFKFKKKVHLVNGGKTRQESVYNGLKSVLTRVNFRNENIVMIHDGVRPFIGDDLIKNCIDNAVKYGACIPAVKITDTIKQVSTDFCIEKTINRDLLYSAQTPQTFKLNLIVKAFEHAVKTKFSGTDDASILENAGESVHIIKGSRLNIKITTPEDLLMGKYLLTLKARSA